MKRFGRVTMLVLLMVVMMHSVVFAAGTLKLVESYPKDGSKNAALDNFGVKLYFNEDIYSDDAHKSINDDCFVIKDENGKVVPTVVVYSPKEKNMALVLAKQDGKSKKSKDAVIEQDTKYTLTISKKLQAVNGDQMAKAESITFKTLNQSRTSMVSVGLMVVMFAGIFIASSRAAKRELKKKIQEEKVNPYKVAKETGKSVEDVVAADQKAKKKKAEREEWRAILAEDDDDVQDTNKRVKGPRPISAGGSTYITGRKAIAEKKEAAAKAKGTTNSKQKAKKKRKK